jgi:small subunit ribosomal protein S17
MAETKPKKKPADKKAAARTETVAAPTETVAAAPAPSAPLPSGAKVPGRKERRGVVVSDRMERTIVVRIDSLRKHPLYHKPVRRSTKLHAHDHGNAAHVGDTVRVVECRPLSKTKRWRLVEILERAK